MATYWKLFLMFTLAGVTVILSTAVVTLRLMYEHKLQRLEHLKKKRKNKKPSTSSDEGHTKKSGLHRTNSKTIRKSFPVDTTTELFLHRTTSASTSNPRTAADAHLGQALRLIPFEKEGGKDGRGNALPPKLIHGEVGDGRGRLEDKAKKSWDAWKRFGGGGYGSNYEPDAGGTLDARSHATTTTTPKRRKGGLIRRIRDALSSTPTTTAPTTNNFQTEREAVYHLEQAAELGHHYAQNVLANSLASGILPVPDSPGLRNHSSTPLHVTSDFTEGGEQLARALILWHLSAMDGNIESAMAMGYRHLYSAKTGHKQETVTDRGLLESLFTEDEQRIGTSSKRRRLPSHDSSPSSHYGVLGTCESALAYYEAAADAVMDEVESSPLRGKVTPASDQHRLAEMYQRGTSSALSYNNKPDELDEALTYYKMRASTKNPQPDVHAAYKLATMYHYGLKGVKQDLAQAFKYYQIAADHGSWEAAGQAGKFHLWGMGIEEEKRDLQKAYEYFEQAAPGGLDGCQYRYNKNMQNKMKQAQDELDLDDDVSEVSQCDHPAVNGMGLLHVFGVPKTVGVNVTLAHDYFILARDMGNMDAYYNLAMLHLGWMNPGYGEALTRPDFKSTNRNKPSYPSRRDFRTALSYLERAAKRGHWQAKYHLAKLRARGAITRPGNNRVEQAVRPACSSALKLYKEVADGGTTVTGRMRTAFKQYTKGDYDSSLRNYIAAAETGSMDAQVNAAFLLEQGHCLGMDSRSCLRASLRMWKAAARQGNEEACLRVGDFYYYNRLEDGTETSRADVYSIATSPYTRYLLYPEDLLQLASRSLTAAIKRLVGTSGSTRTQSKFETSETCDAKGDGDNTCSNPRSTAAKKDEIEKKRFAQAAEYYRLAAKEHGSERANFNLGIMHQHGLGLTQDFPLAKRHYDLAAAGKSGDGIFAVQISLMFMNLHESVLKLRMYLEKRLGELADSDSSVVGSTDPNLVESRRLMVVGIIISHVFSWETVIILVLLFVLKKLLLRRQNRNPRG